MFKPSFSRAGAVGACVLAAALFSAAAHAAGPELVTNGGFETGDFTGFTATPASGASLFGVDDQGPSNGTFSAFFGALEEPDTISQSVATTAGTSYTVSFFLDSSVTDGAPASFVGRFGGTTFISLSEADADFAFRPFSFQLMATAASTALSFSAFHNNLFYTLDDVSVTAVPEPSTYVLMALGLAALGLAARRGKTA